MMQMQMASNEIQALTISNDTIYLSSGGNVVLPTYSTFSGSYIDLTNKPVIPVNTSDLTNNSGFIISPNDADSDATNEIQVLSISNDTIYLTNGGYAVLPASGNGDFNTLINVPAGIADGDDDTQLTEAQVDAYANNNGYLSTEVDGDATNELQTLSVTNDNLSLSNGNSVNLSSVDNQTISLSGTNLSINNGNTVSLAAFLQGTPYKIQSANTRTRIEVDNHSAYYANKILFTADNKSMMAISKNNIWFPSWNRKCIYR